MCRVLLALGVIKREMLSIHESVKFRIEVTLQIIEVITMYITPIRGSITPTMRRPTR